MTFDEWWEKTDAFKEIPQGSNLYPLVRLIAQDAWVTSAKDVAGYTLELLDRNIKSGKAL